MQIFFDMALSDAGGQVSGMCPSRGDAIGHATWEPLSSEIGFFFLKS